MKVRAGLSYDHSLPETRSEVPKAAYTMFLGRFRSGESPPGEDAMVSSKDHSSTILCAVWFRSHAMVNCLSTCKGLGPRAKVMVDCSLSLCAVGCGLTFLMFSHIAAHSYHCEVLFDTPGSRHIASESQNHVFSFQGMLGNGSRSKVFLVRSMQQSAD